MYPPPSRVRPLKDYLLIEPDRLPKTTASGLHLPSTSTKPKSLHGKILAMGRGRILDSGVRAEPEVKIGDRVVVMTHNMAQHFSPLGGEDGPMLVPEADVIAVLDEPPEVPNAVETEPAPPDGEVPAIDAAELRAVHADLRARRDDERRRIATRAAGSLVPRVDDGTSS